MINKTSTRAWMGISKSRLANKIYLDKMYISKPTRRLYKEKHWAQSGSEQFDTKLFYRHMAVTSFKFRKPKMSKLPRD